MGGKYLVFPWHEMGDDIVDMYVSQKLMPYAIVACLEQLGYANVTVRRIEGYLSKRNVKKRSQKENQELRMHGGTFYKHRTCEACNNTYVPSSVSQRLCKICVPTGRWGYIARTYGITKSDFEAMLLEQNMCCGTCDKSFVGLPTSKMSIDHCHLTGRVRGIVCPGCNARLATYDDKVWLEKARRYVERPGIMPRLDCKTIRSLAT
jgi:hypothetical protein